MLVGCWYRPICLEAGQSLEMRKHSVQRATWVEHNSQHVLLHWDFSAEDFDSISVSLPLLLSTFVTTLFMQTVHSHC